LNILETLTGISAAIVPHWNNNEGATHDTSRCFIGEARLTQLERLLPAGAAVLGIDEHTALTIDLGAQAVSVSGKGAVTIRIPGVGETALHSGATESLTTFAARFGATPTVPVRAPLVQETAEAFAATALSGSSEPPAATRAELVPAIERLIALRATAREERRFTDADGIRDAIEALGVEIKDEPTGATWRLRA